MPKTTVSSGASNGWEQPADEPEPQAATPEPEPVAAVTGPQPAPPAKPAKET